MAVVLAAGFAFGRCASATATATAGESSANVAAPSAVQVLPVAPGIDMLTVDGVNVALQTGPDGTLLVDTGPLGAATRLAAAVAKIINPHQPIRYVIDTGADAALIGGNATIASAGQSPQDMDTFAAGQQSRLSRLLALPGSGSVATIIARQGVLTRMVGDPGVNYSSAGLPTATFARDEFNFIFNEPIAIVATPAAHSDADAVVRFERSDVVVAGAIFDQTRFPVIDRNHGGSVRGEIAALNRVINTLDFEQIPVLSNTGGTQVIPIRGPLSDSDDVVTYRDMIATISDRIGYGIDHGRTLQQIEAADPTEGYEARYGSNSGSWTTRDFVDAVYNSLQQERRARRARR
ncbi:MAG: hypothetical protein ACRET0_00405 [Steroidobacteraceae bacterium]